MNELKLTIIGLSDQKKETFTLAESLEAEACCHFAGGHRHHRLVEHLLPQNHHWVNIDVPLTPFINLVKETGGAWVIFASGDPLFFGIANTLQRECPEARMSVFPSFNALQMLAHTLMIPYGLYETVTLTGRDWTNFDSGLIRQVGGMGILTDRTKSPTAIAKRMLTYGYDQYLIHVGERLGGEHQRVRTMTVEEAAFEEFESPNALFVVKTQTRSLAKAIPDANFIGLEGRPRMITKMPIRMISLMMMQLHNRKVMWDIGACTGSIAIEAKLMAPHLEVVAFEKRIESRFIISKNCRNFGAPGIHLLIDDFRNVDKQGLKKPDAVFLGGYGGMMETILDEIKTLLAPCGCIVFNSVSEESKTRFLQWSRTNQFHLAAMHTIAVDQHNAITIMAIGSTPFTTTP